MASRANSKSTKNHKLSSYFMPLGSSHTSSKQWQPQALPPPPQQLTPSKPSCPTQPTFVSQLAPYPHAPLSFPTSHPQVTIEPVKTAHIPSLMRITGLLLPIRYPTSFYSATITDLLVASVSRVAIYHNHPVVGSDLAENKFARDTSAVGNTEKVIGGIRCRLESLLETSIDGDGRMATNLYILTLHLLSPYRGQGIAASLLNSLLFDGMSGLHDLGSANTRPPVSALVKHYNIRTVTAHVHETNKEALQWYVSRGFRVQDGVIQGYYHKLKPGGARIVKLDLNWDQEHQEQCSDPEFSQQALDFKLTFQKDEDDEWEKVDALEYPMPEALEDYEKVDRNGEDEGSTNKRIRST
ncbi:hypothetical protein LOZ35_000806 [Ophidiomyces ophidiicola]|nr:hypothetical protein LOZ35_000806 [Ophidiomyces ophidiicola]